MSTKNPKETPSQDANRDPLTGEPGSHPIGTGVGAAAGGAAAGAAIGTVAGPIGTGVGAAVGAVAGAMAGKAIAEKINPTEAGYLCRFIDYTVVDRSGAKVGGIDAVWQDDTKQPAYVAVRTGWLGAGRAHVVPAHLAEINEAQRTLRVPFSIDEIKNAPSFETKDDLTAEREFTISSHYGIGRDWNRPMRGSEHAQSKSGDDSPAEAAGAQNEPGSRGGEKNQGAVRRGTAHDSIRLRKVTRSDIPAASAGEPRERSGHVTEGRERETRTSATSGKDVFIPVRPLDAAGGAPAPALRHERESKLHETDKKDIAA